MRTITVLILFAGLALIAGCGDRKPAAKTFADTQVQALQKAREVEGKLAESAERSRAAIEQSTGSRTDP